MDYSNLNFSMGNLKFHTLNIGKGTFKESVPSHVHSLGSYEVHYTYEGSGRLVANGTSYDLAKGILYLTGPKIYHEQILNPVNPMSEYCIYFSIESQPSQKPSLISESFLHHTFWIGFDTQNLEALFEELIHELNTANLGKEFVIRSLLTQLIIKLVRNYEQEAKASMSVLQNTPEHFRYLMIEQIFLCEYSTVTLPSLAARIGLSQRQTERLLHTQYHNTFQKKKLEARMSAAKQLLENTDKKIFEIAEIVGYSTTEHFCNVFRGYFKCSAQEFRKRN